MTLAALGTTGALAQGTATVVVRDDDDVGLLAPDLKRVAATRAADGSVRLAVSLVEPFTPRDLLADAGAGGPPGSLCVRLWTAGSPGTTKPDLLACVTSLADGRTLRTTITREVTGGLPSTVATGTPTRPSDRSVVLRVPAPLLARAKRVAFAGEATRPGCIRLSCVDLSPDAGVTKSLPLR